MIFTVDNTTEWVSELNVSFQFNFHLNKEVISASALSLMYITQQFLHRKFVCPNQTPLLSRGEKSWELAFHEGLSTAIVQKLSRMVPMPMNSMCTRYKGLQVAISTCACSQPAAITYTMGAVVTPHKLQLREFYLYHWQKWRVLEVIISDSLELPGIAIRVTK